MVEGIQGELKPGDVFWWCIDCAIQTTKTDKCPTCGKPMHRCEITSERVRAEMGTAYRVKTS
jgi:rRNA maturation endonuclease Nob1